MERDSRHESNLHVVQTISSNIQVNTSITDRTTDNINKHPMLDTVHKADKEHGISLLLANCMSIALRINEVQYVLLDQKPDLAVFTETCLSDKISKNHLTIPGYYLSARNRISDPHGGMYLYIKNCIKFKTLNQLYNPDFESLWTWIRPPRLPRGTPCLVVGTVYHPPSPNDGAMLNHLSTTLTLIEGQYPGKKEINPGRT